MAAFFAKTWFFWYAFAVFIIMRWFHVTAPDVEPDIQGPHPVETTNEGESLGPLNCHSSAGKA
jgi:hypothetical protein